MSAAACIDASVAAKWVIPEEDTGLAAALLDELRARDVWLIAPPHIVAEVTSAVYKRFRRGTLLMEDAQRALGEFMRAGVGVLSVPPLAERAVELAARLDLSTPYDAFYLALGEIVDCEVWTADAEFFRRASPDYPRLRLLAQFRWT